MLKTDKIIVTVITVFVLLIIICICLNCINSSVHTLPHIYRKGSVINPSVDNNSFEQNSSLLSVNNQENFQMPFDREYVDPLLFTADVTMEFDPEDLINGELPNFAPIASLEKEILEEEAKEEELEKEESEINNLEQDKEKEKEDNNKIKKNSKTTVIKGGGGTLEISVKDDEEIQAFKEGLPEFYRNCRKVAKVGEDGFTHKYNFAKNSALLGTFYVKLFHQKCTDYFKEKKKNSINKLLKLNLPSYQISRLQDQVEELGYDVEDEDIKLLEDIINKNSPQVEKELENLLQKKGKEAQDLDNMYLTRESKEDENIVDTIQSISNNEEKAEEGEDDLVMCLKRYRADEDRCFTSRKKSKGSYCRIPKCFEPKLVIGSCTINSIDMPPYYFEENAHFVIQKHPDDPRKRIIYMNRRGDSRRCESDPKYFSKYLEIRRKERLIELAENKIQFIKTQEVILDQEQEKEYLDLEKKIEELESSQGEFTAAPGETKIDYHAQTQERNKELKESKEKYSQFKQKIRDKKIEEEKKKKADLIKELQELKNQEKKIDDSKKKISSKICLKYALVDDTVLVKLLYEDDRRNLLKGYRSDWFVVKHLDNAGKETGFYKFKGEIGGYKFNLSKKPRPKEMKFYGFGFFVFEPKPKLEDQLWLIKEVGDLNKPVVLGEVKEETEIRRIGAKQDEKHANKAVKWT